MKTGTFTTYQNESISELMDIRNGKYTHGNKLDLKFYEYVTKLEMELEDVYQHSNILHEMVDKNKLNDLMIQMYFEKYGIKKEWKD